jgi:hypothetical protein
MLSPSHHTSPNGGREGFPSLLRYEGTDPLAGMQNEEAE